MLSSLFAVAAGRLAWRSQMLGTACALKGGRYSKGNSSLPVELCRLPRLRTKLSRCLELRRLLRLKAKSQSLIAIPSGYLRGRRRSGPNRRVGPGITNLNMPS